ncbi:FYB1 protein, partial [Amia calva]|nr:FYB1 protein [Amia calva]
MWLARTLTGNYGYISNTCVDVDYEEVKRKIRNKVFESPNPACDEDFYDDVGSSDQMNSSTFHSIEDVYDDVQPISDSFPPPPPEICLNTMSLKEEKELRKTFKIEGPIEVLCQMMVDPEAKTKKGGGKDLPVIPTQIVDVIRMGEKKVLCRNEHGKCT